jgi:hypothetical protein
MYNWKTPRVKRVWSDQSDPHNDFENKSCAIFFISSRSSLVAIGQFKLSRSSQNQWLTLFILVLMKFVNNYNSI